MTEDRLPTLLIEALAEHAKRRAALDASRHVGGHRGRDAQATAGMADGNHLQPASLAQGANQSREVAS